MKFAAFVALWHSLVFVFASAELTEVFCCSRHISLEKMHFDASKRFSCLISQALFSCAALFQAIVVGQGLKVSPQDHGSLQAGGSFHEAN